MSEKNDRKLSHELPKAHTPEIWLQEIQRTPPRVPKNAPERPPADQAMREKMDNELIALDNLMKNSGVWWQLDGALNISLYKGEYIGTHADVDISVLREDIPNLEPYLMKRGYGLFVMTKDGDKKIYRRVDAKDFIKTRIHWQWQLRFAAIDEVGAIRHDVNLPIIEVAVMERNKDGQPIGWLNEPMPKKWLDKTIVNFHGASIPISHPARFLFNKIRFARPYDEGDLRELVKTGVLTMNDIQDVAKVLDPTIKSFENTPDAELNRLANLMKERLQKLTTWVKKLEE